MIVITPPDITPVSVDQMKEYLRIEPVVESPSVDDELLESYIEAAVDWVENYTHRALITQARQIMLETFPYGRSFIQIPRPPLQVINSVKYLWAGETDYIDWPDEDWGTDVHMSRLFLKFGRIWPFGVFDPSNAILLEYDCGYGDDPEDVPMAIRTAIKFAVANWYENREPVVVGVISSKVAFTLESLLAPYRWNMGVV